MKMNNSKLEEIITRLSSLDEKLDKLIEMLYGKPTLAEEDLLREYLFGEVKND